MNYEIKFYYGKHTNEVAFLGSYQLADEYTFNHYKTLIDNGVPFSIWFEHYDSEYSHRNVIVDETTIKSTGTTDNGETQVIFVIANENSRVQFLTREQFNDQNKIDELIQQVSREDISRYFN